MNTYNNIGEYLKEKRNNKKLSLRALSTLSSVSHTEISKIENNLRDNINPNILYKICNSLDVNFYDFCKLFNLDYKIDVNSFDNLQNNTPVIDKDNLKINLINEICKELNDKYELTLNYNDFDKDYRVNNNTIFDYICFTHNDIVIGIDIRFVKDKINTHICKAKSVFADFYFNFFNCYNKDSMIFYTLFICENDDVYNNLYKIYKNSFYMFRPIMNSKVYCIS